MPAVDFTEIPPANSGGGLQDTFEVFASEFLDNYGLLIEQGPGRGPDGGRDLIVIERRAGVAGETLFRWLVSCKHYAPSGKAVGVDDELNIGDRVKAANANGFMGFFSTLPSSALVTRLNELKKDFEHTFFTTGRIESELTKSTKGLVLLKRFFPKSHARWVGDHPSKPDLLIHHKGLLCKHCGKNLLQPELTQLAMVTWWQSVTPNENGQWSVKNFYWCCKGTCDYALKAQFQDEKFVDAWEELFSYTIPTLYIRSITSLISYINDRYIFDEEAIQHLMEFITITFHAVARNLTEEEIALVKLHQEVGAA